MAKKKLRLTNFNHTKNEEGKHLHAMAYVVRARMHAYISFSSGLFALKITLVAMNGHNCVFVHVIFFACRYRSFNGIQIKCDRMIKCRRTNGCARVYMLKFSDS